jgi:hypothetical protein
MAHLSYTHRHVHHGGRFPMRVLFHLYPIQRKLVVITQQMHDALLCGIQVIRLGGYRCPTSAIRVGH